VIERYKKLRDSGINEMLRGVGEYFRVGKESIRLILVAIENGGKMEVIRTIETVKNGQILLNLPSELSGQEVEVIVLSKKIAKPKKKSLRGALQKYAKPELIPLEAKAWENAVEEKYVDR
jgi:hypothetical protein